MTALVVATFILAPSTALAAGTPACTQITSQATVNYFQLGNPRQALSNTVSTQVVELIDQDLSWQDADFISVQPGDSSRVLSFRLSNTGNGTESFALTALSIQAGDDFDPMLVSVHLDTNSNGLFDPLIDEKYFRGVNDPTLAADAFGTVFLINDIPLDLENEDVGLSSLTASALTGIGNPGDIFAGLGDCGTDAVIGTSRGRGKTVGGYLVSAVTIEIQKTFSVADSQGGQDPVTGAVITFTLEVTATGAGTALGVVITDVVPPPNVLHPRIHDPQRCSPQRRTRR
jgi:uncharacterized repeat protein (TIGR01451 family)